MITLQILFHSPSLTLQTLLHNVNTAFLVIIKYRIISLILFDCFFIKGFRFNNRYLQNQSVQSSVIGCIFKHNRNADNIVNKTVDDDPKVYKQLPKKNYNTQSNAKWRIKKNIESLFQQAIFISKNWLLW